MAHIHTVHPTRGVFEKAAAMIHLLGGALVRLAEANALVRETERLSAMTDEQLRAYGVGREDIVHHVFLGRL